MLLASVAFCVTVDLLTEARGVAAIVIIYVPRYLLVVTALILIWLVSKGRDTCLVPVERIQCISAAGNCVEILSENRNYLLRSTMKKVQELLPPSYFIRVHRSHIVNLNEIDRICSRRSGNGTVVLRCGKTVRLNQAREARSRS